MDIDISTAAIIVLVVFALAVVGAAWFLTKTPNHEEPRKPTPILPKKNDRKRR